MSCRLPMTLLFLCLGGLAIAADSPLTQPPLGTSLLDLKLFAPNKETNKPADEFSAAHTLREKKALVLIFIEPHCPVCVNYQAAVEKMMVQFKDDQVAWAVVDASFEATAEEIASHRADTSWKIPYLHDPQGKWAERLKVDRVPCAVVADSGGKVRYRGRIDDQFAPGIARSKANTSELASALRAVIDGKDVAQAWTETAGCLRTVARPKKLVATAEMTWGGGVAAIIQNKCQGCHRPGEAAPFGLMNYKDAVAWADMIKEVVQNNVMPPWHAESKPGHFSNDRRLNEAEKKNLLAWIDAGCPQGDMAKAPANPNHETGWRAGKPDQVFTMGREVKVPASYLFGAMGMPYQYILGAETIKEDCWVKTIEVRPDQRGQIHHIIVFIIPEGAKFPDVLRSGPDSFGGAMLGAYVPGDFPIVYGEGFAKKLPKGAKLLFEMHYTPNGKAVVDRSSVGVTYAKEAPKHEVRTRSIANNRFRIPPGDANHEVKSATKFHKPAVIMSYSPHMHLRGKDFAMDLIDTDKTRTGLLRVPNYDFNWQESYHLAKFLRVQPGQVIECTAHFDNSANNPANPDPKKEVRWGDMTWEEMMIGFVDYYYE